MLGLDLRLITTRARSDIVLLVESQFLSLEVLSFPSEAGSLLDNCSRDLAGWIEVPPRSRIRRILPAISLLLGNQRPKPLGTMTGMYFLNRLRILILILVLFLLGLAGIVST